MKVDKSKWRKTTLEALCTKGSSNIVISKTDIGGGEYPLYGANGKLGNISFYHNEKPYLGIIKDGSGVGRVDKYPALSSLVGTMQYLYPTELADIDFLKYLLRYLNLAKYVEGAAIPHIYYKKYKDEQVVIPTLEEQEKIVSELDKIQAMIDGYKAQIADLDALAQSIFLDSFGDPVTNPKGWYSCKLKEVSTLITNGTTPKGGEKVYVDTGIIFFRSQNVWKNRLVMDDVAYINDATNASMKGSVLHHNDLLITKTGRVNTENSSLGRTALYTGEDSAANINGHVYLVRLNGTINPKFVLYILISESFKTLIRKVCVGAIDKRQLNLSHIENFPIILPPLEAQNKFANQVDVIENLKSSLFEQVADCELLMAERMQEYFS